MNKLSTLALRLAGLGSMAIALHASLVTGTVQFDGQTRHYAIYTGTDVNIYNSFLSGGTLINFENINGVTAYNATNYNNGAVSASNLVSSQTPINGIYFSSGGQTPGNPTNGTPFSTVWVQLNGVQGAHSGTHVLAPSDSSNTQVQFSGSFFSFGVPTAQALSRIGWWSNPLMSTAASTPNLHVVDGAGTDFDNFLFNNNIKVSIQPGDFFAIAFDKPIIEEVEFATAPDHYTLDDVVYSRDNAVNFGGGTTTPEPSGMLLSAFGLGLAFLPRFLRRSRG